MNTESIKEQYQRDGFALGPRVLTDSQIEELHIELDRVIEDRDREAEIRPNGEKSVLLRNFAADAGKVTWQIVDIWCASTPFFELAKNPEITALAAEISDANSLKIWHDQIQYKLATTGGTTAWHQDSPAWPVIQPKNEQVTAWIPLDDVDESNGCMSMVPGSHRWGVQQEFLSNRDSFDLPESFEGSEIKRVLRPVGRGEVHFHHPLTWHGSHANESDRPRRAIAVHYATERVTYDASGDHPMKPYIKVDDGESLEGDFFPLVWSVS